MCSTGETNDGPTMLMLCLIFINHCRSTRCICRKIVHLFTTHRMDFLQWFDWEGVTLINWIELSRQLHLDISMEGVSPSAIDLSSNWLAEKDSLPMTLWQSSVEFASFFFTTPENLLLDQWWEGGKILVSIFVVCRKVKHWTMLTKCWSLPQTCEVLSFAMKGFPLAHFDAKRFHFIDSIEGKTLKKKIVRHWKRTEQEERERERGQILLLDESSFIECEKNKSHSPIDLIEISSSTMKEVLFPSPMFFFPMNIKRFSFDSLPIRWINRFLNTKKKKKTRRRKSSSSLLLNSLFKSIEVLWPLPDQRDWREKFFSSSLFITTKKRKTKISSFGRWWTNRRTFSSFLSKDLLLEKFAGVFDRSTGAKSPPQAIRRRDFLSRRDSFLGEKDLSKDLRSFSLINEQLKKKLSPSMTNNNRSIQITLSFFFFSLTNNQCKSLRLLFGAFPEYQKHFKCRWRICWSFDWQVKEKMNICSFSPSLSIWVEWRKSCWTLSRLRPGENLFLDCLQQWKICSQGNPWPKNNASLCWFTRLDKSSSSFRFVERQKIFSGRIHSQMKIFPNNCWQFFPIKTRRKHCQWANQCPIIRHSTYWVESKRRTISITETKKTMKHPMKIFDNSLISIDPFTHSLPIEFFRWSMKSKKRNSSLEINNDSRRGVPIKSFLFLPRHNWTEKCSKSITDDVNVIGQRLFQRNRCFLQVVPHRERRIPDNSWRRFDLSMNLFCNAANQWWIIVCQRLTGLVTEWPKHTYGATIYLRVRPKHIHRQLEETEGENQREVRRVQTMSSISQSNSTSLPVDFLLA